MGLTKVEAAKEGRWLERAIAVWGRTAKAWR
jgi:hypothetical protein